MTSTNIPRIWWYELPVEISRKIRKFWWTSWRFSLPTMKKDKLFFKTTVKEQILKWPLLRSSKENQGSFDGPFNASCYQRWRRASYFRDERKRWTHGHGKYDLMTKASQKVVGRHKQLDEGAGRQTWKCHDPLNCVVSIAFRKHGTCWAQTWTWHFRGTCINRLEPLTSVVNGIAWCSDYSNPHGYSTSISLIYR